jgi:hypothetical protein
MPELNKLEDQTLRYLLSLENKYARQIQKQLLETLGSVYGELKKIYDKWSIKGKLTKAEMTKYNKYQTMEKDILKKIDPALKANIKTIKKLMPEQFQESFYHYAWAIDQSVGVQLKWGMVNTKTLIGAASTFDLNNVKNIELRRAIKRYGPEAKEKIRSALLKGLSEGKTFEQMAREIKKGINKIYSSAMTITRTEGMRAINLGQFIAYQRAEENGVEGIDVWSSTKDGATRPTHRMADGQKRGEKIKDAFSIGGFKALYPHDPNLPAQEAINCIPEYEIPIGFDVEKLFKRYYKGFLINIKTASGFEFSVTPNHPVLTDQGWIAANLLNKSSNIIGLDFGKQINSSNLNVNNRPMIVSKIFDLFQIMGSCQRQCGTNFQFHGDGGNSNVNIETINSHLWNSFQSAFYKPLIQKFFTHSNILSCFLFCFSSFCKFLFFSFHSAYSVMSSFSQCLSFFWSRLRHTQIHRSRSSSRFNIINNKNTSNNITADIKHVCKSFFRHPVKILSDNVIMIKSIPYSGHVYNLQTKDGFYILYNDNGKMSIVHNCRCTLRKEIKGYSSQLMRTREEGVLPYMPYTKYAEKYHPEWIVK